MLVQVRAVRQRGLDETVLTEAMSSDLQVQLLSHKRRGRGVNAPASPYFRVAR